MLANRKKAERAGVVEPVLSEADKAANTEEVDAFFQSRFEEGFRDGIGGNTDDALATAMPRGFEPSSIRVRLQIWHGKHDRFVHFSHGRWLAAGIPKAEAHLEGDEGHISTFVNRVSEV